MSEISVRKEVRHATDAVWTAVRTFGGVEAWIPMIAASEVEGQGAGATRVCTTGDGGRLVERLEELDDDAKRLAYSIVDSPLPVQNYRSTMSVLPAGTGSLVVWNASFDVVGAEPAEVESMMRDVYASGLDGLDAFLTEA